MRITNRKSLFCALAAVSGSALSLSAAAAPPRLPVQEAAVGNTASSVSAPLLLVVNAERSQVHWTLPSTLHTVHGTFQVKRGEMSFDPKSGKAGGEIVVNAKSGESGNDSRDERMHKEILETAKYPEVVFRPTEVQGQVAANGPSDVKVHGTFSVHGSDHEVTALVHAELAGQTWKGTAQFDVPYVDWGIKNPSNFFLKVKKVVSVEVELSGTVQTEKP